MPSIALRILFKVILLPFYRKNAGLFLVLFLFFFGVVPPYLLVYYHLQLIMAVASSFIVLTLALLFWSLYLYHIWNFWMHTFSLKENSFLYHFSLLPGNIQSTSIIVTHSLMYAPVASYILAVIVVAIRLNIAIAAICILFLLIGTWLMVYSVSKRINELHEQRRLISFFPSVTVKASSFNVLLRGLWYGHQKSLMVTKIVSLALISGAYHLYLDTQKEIRILWIAGLLISSFHIVIFMEIKKMEDREAGFIRGLPLTLLSRFFSYSKIFIVLIIPETMLLLVKDLLLNRTFESIYISFSFLLLCISISVSMYLILFHQRIDPSRYVKFIFFLFLLLLYIIMIPRAYFVLVPLLLIIGYCFFYKNYDRYEPSRPL